MTATAKQRPVARLLVLALLSIVIVTSGSACGEEDDGVGGLVDVLTAAKYEVSILTLNLRGIHEDWEDGTRLPWRDRYDRVARWTKETNTRPDLVGLQEVWLRKRFFAGGLEPHDYETLFELIGRMNAQTGAHYRIAYASSHYVPQGANSLWAGEAVVYNSDRLRNSTAASLAFTTGSETMIRWDDRSVIGAHVRQSHPCAETRPEHAGECALIDGDGRYVTLSYKTSSGTWRLGATGSSFALKNDPALELLVHNVHVDLTDYAAAFRALRDLLTETNRRWAGREQPYPPILQGDFNVGHSDMRLETGSGILKDYEIAGYAQSDVVGVLIGDQTSYPSRFSPVTEPQVLPIEAPTPEALCSPGSSLWSDHCAIFVSIHPPIRTSNPG